MVLMYFFHLQLHRAVWIHTTLDVNVSSVQVSPTPPQFPVRQRRHITDTIFLCSNTQESKVEKKEGVYYM